MSGESGREGWSDLSLWYNYRINGLIESRNIKEAEKLVDSILGRFPKQQKFFLRLKALANHITGNLPGAEALYKQLCNKPRPDWWILHEYARVVRDLGRKEDALNLMCQAASNQSRLGPMVSLIEDIGNLLKELEKYEESRVSSLSMQVYQG